MGITVSFLASYVEHVIFELYADISATKSEADTEEVTVQVRDHLYQFSPSVINDFLGLFPLIEEERYGETTLDAVTTTEVVEFL